jgi:hypothetical protein
MHHCATWRCGTKICAIAVEKKHHHRPLALVWWSQLWQADDCLIFDLMGHLRATLQYEPKSVTLTLER